MKYLLFFYSLTLLFSCKNEPNKEKNELLSGSFIIKKNIVGDFNGDGSTDTLKESIISTETNKSIDVLPSIEYESLVEFIMDKKPKVTLIGNDQTIPTLFIAREDQLFGLQWLKNEGDLDNDGGDEISVVIDWADWSAINKCIVFTLKNGKWKKYASFEIREWQMDKTKVKTDFSGFITKNDQNEFIVQTFDSEVNEVFVPLKEKLVKNE